MDGVEKATEIQGKRARGENELEEKDTKENRPPWMCSCMGFLRCEAPRELVGR